MITVRGQAREVLTANRSYFLATTGSDTNDGRTSGTAWKTPLHAWTVIRDTLDLANFVVTVNIANGTWTGTDATMWAWGTPTGLTDESNVVFLGNTVTPSSVYMNGSGWHAVDGAMFHVEGIQFNTDQVSCLSAEYPGSMIDLVNVVFATTTQYHIRCLLGGIVSALGNYSAGSAARHISIEDGGFVYLGGQTITFTGTPAWSGAFCVISGDGILDVTGTTFSGATTGQRHIIADGGAIVPSGTSLPGNVAGAWTVNGSTVTGIGAFGSVNLAAAVTVDATGRVTSASTNAIRELLTADRTYYVRPDGSDSNNGLTNSAVGAFLTIQKAIDTASALDLSTHNVTVQLAASATPTTFTGQIQLRNLMGSGSVTIKGDEANPQNWIITSSSGSSGAGVVGDTTTTSPWRGTYILDGVKLTSGGSNIHCITVTGGGAIVQFKNVQFGAASGGHIVARQNGEADCVGNYTINGNATYHTIAAYNGTVVLSFPSVTITLSGTPAFSGAFVLASDQSLIRAGGVTYSGSATGSRYSVADVSLIDTAGGGATYFPGNAGGTAGNTWNYI